MIELQSISRYSHPGHEDMRIVAAPFEMDRANPEIIGQTILIDGEKKVVRLVERHMPGIPIWVGEEIGLSVVSPN